MKVHHACGIPGKDLPLGVKFVKARWRCPICGQVWLVKWWGAGGYEASYSWTFFPNLKKWRWRRMMSNSLS